MTLDTNKINHIIAALDLHIEEANACTGTVWTREDNYVIESHGILAKCLHVRSHADAAFIAHARELSPLACQSLKIAIEGLLELAKAYNMEHGKAAISILHSITNRWPSPTE